MKAWKKMHTAGHIETNMIESHINRLCKESYVLFERLSDQYRCFLCGHSFVAWQQNAIVVKEGLWNVYHLPWEEFRLLSLCALLRKPLNNKKYHNWPESSEKKVQINNLYLCRRIWSVKSLKLEIHQYDGERSLHD